ncbi:MAG: four helix bundle protein [Flavobacteriales bacterium]
MAESPSCWAVEYTPLGELHTQLRLIHGRKIIDDHAFQSFEKQILELQRMLRSFLKRLSG